MASTHSLGLGFILQTPHTSQTDRLVPSLLKDPHSLLKLNILVVEAGEENWAEKGPEDLGLPLLLCD